MTTKKRKTFLPGDVFAIPLKAGGYAFGLVCYQSEVTFFNFRSETPTLPDDLQGLPVAFRISVSKDAPAEGGWDFAGRVELRDDYAKPGRFLNKPVGSKQCYIYSAGEKVPASDEECKGLELMSSYFACHVDERLEDFFAGREYRHLAVIKQGLGIDF